MCRPGRVVAPKLSPNEIIQLPTRKLRDRVSLSEPLAFPFPVTVQPFGRFVARRRHCALADCKSGERRDGLAWWEPCAAQRGGGGVPVVAAHLNRY